MAGQNIEYEQNIPFDEVIQGCLCSMTSDPPRGTLISDVTRWTPPYALLDFNSRLLAFLLSDERTDMVVVLASPGCVCEALRILPVLSDPPPELLLRLDTVHRLCDSHMGTGAG